MHKLQLHECEDPDIVTLQYICRHCGSEVDFSKPVFETAFDCIDCGRVETSLECIDCGRPETVANVRKINTWEGLGAFRKGGTDD